MSRRSVVVAVVAGAAVPLAGGLLAAPLAAAGGIVWESIEGAIVSVALLLAELVVLRLLGRHVRLAEKAERLAARNARIRAAGEYVEVAPL